MSTITSPGVKAGPSLTARLLASQRFSNLTIFGLLVAIIVFFTVVTPSGTFFSNYNLTSIALAGSQLLILSAGVTFLLIAAGLDLSVGAVVVFSSVLAAKLMLGLTSGLASTAQGGAELWLPILAGVGAGVVTGAAWGLVNGMLVVKSKIPSFIVTLATSTIILGLAQVWTGGMNVSGVPQALTDAFGMGTLLGVPWPVVTAAAVTGLLWVVLARTRFGLRTYAIGANPEAARRAGINVDRHLLAIYCMVGLLAGLVGMIDISRFSTASVSGYANIALQSITAVIIGGTSLWGGRGKMSGTVVGAFIPATLTSGFVIMNLQPFWQNVAVGCVLIFAVFVDQYRRRAMNVT
ncbi:ABC transporter permease [Nonomuraea ferruginea]